jgi:hypothetical protein
MTSSPTTPTRTISFASGLALVMLDERGSSLKKFGVEVAPLRIWIRPRRCAQSTAFVEK